MVVVFPIVILFIYSKEHTYIEQNQVLSPELSKYFTHEYTIVYVGYTGCRTVCEPRLKEISIIQRILKDKGDHLQYMFLDLRTLDIDVSEHFLKAFDGNFGLLFLDNFDKDKFLRELGVYYTKSMYNKDDFEHNSYIYLIEKKNNNVKLIATIMQFPFLNEKTIEFLHKRVNNGAK